MLEQVFKVCDGPGSVSEKWLDVNSLHPKHSIAQPHQLTVFTIMVLYSASGAIFLDWMVSIQGTHLPRSLSNTKSYT